MATTRNTSVSVFGRFTSTRLPIFQPIFVGRSFGDRDAVPIEIRESSRADPEVRQPAPSPGRRSRRSSCVFPRTWTVPTLMPVTADSSGCSDRRAASSGLRPPPLPLNAPESTWKSPDRLRSTAALIESRNDVMKMLMTPISSTLEHQRAGGGCGAPRVPHRVLASQAPGDATRPRQRRAKDTYEQRRDHRTQDHDRHEQEARTDQHARPVRSDRAPHEHDRADTQECGAAERADARAARLVDRHLAHRGDRRRPGPPATPGGARIRRSRSFRRAATRRPCAEARPRPRTAAGRRTRENNARSPEASPMPAARPTSAANRPTIAASSRTEPIDLPAARAERAQQRELSGALGDDDAERVVDEEGTGDQRDERESLQDRVEHLSCLPTSACRSAT